MKELKKLCITMLKQWSKSVLTEWIRLYTMILPILVKSGESFEALEKECIETMIKMTDLQQPVDVRVSSTRFFGELARNKTLNKLETYLQKCLPKVKSLCQDFNWEVRRGMCKSLY